MTLPPETGGEALKEALEQLPKQVGALKVPEKSAIARLRIAVYVGPPSPPRPINIEEVAYRVVEAFSTSKLPERKDLGLAAFCVWETQVRLVDIPPAMNGYLRYILEGARRSEVSRLAEAYWRGFSEGREYQSKVAETLGAWTISKSGSWVRRHAVYSVFDVKRGPARLAEIAEAEGIDIFSYLTSRDQMTESLAMGGFAEAAWIHGIRNIGSIDQQEQIRFDRLDSWNGRRTDSLLFPNAKRSFINALLQPYEKSEPARELRDQILNFVLGLLGDPRLKPENWIGVENAASVVTRWLVEQTFRQFLDVVEKISSHETQWEYRRAFWWGVYDKCQSRGVPMNVWVIFGATGAQVARNLFGKNVSFGFLQDKDNSLAAFMIEIGDALFVDWNQDKPCHVWRRDDSRRRPTLYKIGNYGNQAYRVDEIRHRSPKPRTKERLKAAGIVDHHSPSNFHWQRELADEIYSAGGPKLAQIDYRLGRERRN